MEVLLGQLRWCSGAGCWVTACWHHPSEAECKHVLVSARCPGDGGELLTGSRCWWSTAGAPRRAPSERSGRRDVGDGYRSGGVPGGAYSQPRLAVKVLSGFWALLLLAPSGSTNSQWCRLPGSGSGLA